MSSQGPATGSAPTGVPAGYVWNATSIRDSSDWISYKKQRLIYKSNEVATTAANACKLSKYERPWFVNGQDYKLDYLNGKNKCAKCEAGAFNGPTGPISN